MKNGFSVFIAAFIALGLSWCGFVLGPVKQLGTEKQAAILNSSDTYPLQPAGDATLGLQVYRANGCAACHTEQVRQGDVSCEVVLTGVGKNPDKVLQAIQLLSKPKQEAVRSSYAVKLGQKWPGDLPKIILADVDKEEADSASDQITAAGGSVETHIVPVGVDIARGWGVRQSVAADFLYNYPVELGSLRAGPDLANVGARLPDANWQLVHLYAPAAVAKNSAMPPFRFLFEVRKLNGPPSPDALQFPQGFASPAGCEVVPTPAAKQLVAYLLSLKADAPLYEAPFTPVTTKP